MKSSILRKMSLTLILLAGAALVVGVVVYRTTTTLGDDETASFPTRSQSASASAQTGKVSDNPTVPDVNTPGTFAVLGDAYSDGVGAAPGKGWVEQFSKDMCWSLTDRSAQSGTGYTNNGVQESPDYAPFDQRADAVAASRPQFVIVQGGNNDADAPPEQLTEAASRTFESLRATLGDRATIIAIGPVPTTLKDPPSLAPISSAIASAASQYGAVYVDPVAEDWLRSAEFFNEDQANPNEGGYTEFAHRLEASLRQHNIKPTAACG